MLGGWQMSGVTQGQSGRPFTIITGVDSNGDANTGFGSAEHQPGRHVRVGRASTATFTNNGYYVVPLGSNNLPLQNSLGDGNAPRNSERSGRVLEHRPVAVEALRPAGHDRPFIVRIDAFNVFNQDNYGLPVVNMSSVNFGQNTPELGTPHRRSQRQGELLV